MAVSRSFKFASARRVSVAAVVVGRGQGAFPSQVVGQARVSPLGHISVRPLGDAAPAGCAAISMQLSDDGMDATDDHAHTPPS
jgi:hypothetical protein